MTQKVEILPFGKMTKAKPPTSEPIAPAAIAPAAPIADEPTPDERPATPAPAAPVAVAATIKPVGGRTYVHNTVLDSLSAALDAHEFKVYLRLYRLAYGWQSDTCTVSHKTLAVGCKIGKRTAQEVTARLALLGLIEVLPGANSRAANSYRVIVPGSAPAAIARAAIAPPAIAQAAPSKESSKETDSSGVYEIRSVAAPIWEARKHRPGYDHAALVDDVEAAMIGRGSATTRADVESALKDVAR